MAKNNASLKAIAREFKLATAGKKNIVKASAKKSFAMPKGWCGKHSELATDIDWTKVPRGGYFDKTKRDRGCNAALISAMARCGK